MNGMRIKSHKPVFSKTTLPSPERFVRYTPLGAIRLLPPVPSVNVTVVARPGATKKTRTLKTAPVKKRTATRRKTAR